METSDKVLRLAFVSALATLCGYFTPNSLTTFVLTAGLITTAVITLMYAIVAIVEIGETD